MAPALFLGVGGHVVALDPATGQELWRTKLKASSVTTIWSAGQRIYAGSQGEVFCLDAAVGHILWHNKLKGLGQGVVAFPGSEAEAAAAAAAAQAAVAAATA
ncbi:MAG TPA: PQQ-binding-like beta-propeller repeat protein [Steroidobacteraceae bacterium]|nr:PQQ-binding-like beta-propeller repeat protein [Steroidobacteraceae bacterium]